MNALLKKYPVPITGLILGLAAAGNLVQSYGEIFRSLFGIVSAILFVLMIAKVVKYPKDIKESLDNPVVASVFPTFSMAVLISCNGRPRRLIPFSTILAEGESVDLHRARAASILPSWI